ncbi:c-type cytochrome [Bacteriovorax stolpii]|nr:cytochrome c [Bacteriovorax stolpii]
MKNVVMGTLLLALAGCNFIDPDKGPLAFSSGKTIINPIKTDTDKPETEVEKDLVYLDIKKNLFDMSCTRCHNPENAVKKGRLDLTKKELILENYDDIIYRMTDAFDLGIDYMPPRGNRVSPEVIKQLKAWKADQAYLNIQKTVFEASCTKCHNPNNKRRMDLTSKEVIVENYDKILYRMTDAFEEMNRPMPPIGKGERVSAKLVEELKAWKASL